LLLLFQEAPQTPVAAVDRVAHDPGTRHLCFEDTLEHSAGQFGLGRKANRVGNSSLQATSFIRGPLLRQIEFAVDESTALLARIAKKHADLAVLDAAGRAAVLALDPGRMRALLEEACLVHDQHGSVPTKMLDHVLAQVVTDGVSIPGSRIEESLHAIGGGVAEEFGQVPAILALECGEQAPEVAQRSATGFSASETGCYAAMELLQIVDPVLNRLQHVHALDS
jgi:hypothetical protein